MRSAEAIASFTNRSVRASFEGDSLVASSAGEFPGSPQPFAFSFDVDGDLVKGLSIDPA
ncbi:hypothetical protein N1029_06635 [Herbiconiux sp. CPCC 203406]|uniref:hypothetical protein n=1 Tax=Herbiconiux oxytropis TaxID=2970915 RepID=UPI00217E1774|nr:hypothetical protein [Herbiconiux oxytropis]MCS5721660.1 hypothetical protein [Herbiconiux oxytropis]